MNCCKEHYTHTYLLTCTSSNNSTVCRYYQAAKSNNPTMAAKADSLKDEMDEALNKVEICKVHVVLDIYIPARASSSG